MPRADHRKSFVLATAAGPPPPDLPARLARRGLVQDTPGAVAPTAACAHNPATGETVVLLHAPDSFPANVGRTLQKVERCLGSAVGAGRAGGAADATAVRLRAADWLRASFCSDVE
jgi:hypothetical protein